MLHYTVCITVGAVDVMFLEVILIAGIITKAGLLTLPVIPNLEIIEFILFSIIAAPSLPNSG